MKIIPLLFGLAFILTSGLLAQDRPDLATDRIPDSLKNGAHEIVRLEEKIFQVKSEKEGLLSVKKWVTILSKSSDANQVIVFYDGDSKIGKIKANLYDAFGNLLRKINSSEIQDFPANSFSTMAGDNRVKYLEINHNELPFTLEYEYEQLLRGAYYHIYPDWHIQDYYAAIEKGVFRIQIPQDMTFYYKALNTDIRVEESSKDKWKVYEWKVANLQAIEREPYSPPFTQVLPILMFAPDQFEFDGYKGSMASWKDYGLFMNQLYQGRDELPEKLISEVKQLTLEATSDREKIGILYLYLKENTRYVTIQLGIGFWQPFEAEYVYKNKYGDCKALTNYMKAILKEVGIEAFPVLIERGETTYEITEDFTTPKFNHVVLCIPSEDYWLECTSQSLPVNYLGSDNANKTALLVTPDGGTLIRTPDIGENLEANVVFIALEESGAAWIKGINNSNGSRHEWYRALHKNLSEEERKEAFKQYSHLPSFEIEQLQIEAESQSAQARAGYQLLVPRYSVKGGKRLFVPVNAINPFTKVPPELKQRKHPIHLSSGFSEIDSIQLSIPKGYEVESLSEGSFERTTSFASYSANIEFIGGIIHYTRKLEVKQDVLPPEQYDEFRAFFLEVAKQDNLNAVLKKKKT